MAKGVEAGGLGWPMRGLVREVFNSSCLSDSQVEVTSRQQDTWVWASGERSGLVVEDP